jgi:hypothetical protein
MDQNIQECKREMERNEKEMSTLWPTLGTAMVQAYA